MKLKHPVAIGFALAGLLIVVGVSIPVYNFIAPIERQMKAGRKYMDSLTEPDIQRWIERTKVYLAGYDPQKPTIGSMLVPPDLKALKIIRIDVTQDRVVYVWMGGFDHTDLAVERLQDDGFKVTANYDDKRSRVIWESKAPKTLLAPNTLFNLTVPASRSR
ncbi:MAG: hypothetical protein NT105_08140 [Verrucomicrobia bacterium]|nr:hypothetical protein [Verrucomicrobiota bacterium]